MGDHGPYRFLIDTGAQTSLIGPALARELRLTPDLRVEVITHKSSQLMPAVKARNLRIAGHALPAIELVFHDVAELRQLDPTVRGLLGVDALAGSDFSLSPATGRLEFTSNRPRGEVVPFYRVEGRIAVKGRMGSESLTLILDSGCTNVVLFRIPAAMMKTKSIPAN
jgi:hypothetical protein